MNATKLSQEFDRLPKYENDNYQLDGDIQRGLLNIFEYIRHIEVAKRYLNKSIDDKNYLIRHFTAVNIFKNFNTEDRDLLDRHIRIKIAERHLLRSNQN